MQGFRMDLPAQQGAWEAISIGLRPAGTGVYLAPVQPNKTASCYLGICSPQEAGTQTLAGWH